MFLPSLLGPAAALAQPGQQPWGLCAPDPLAGEIRAADAADPGAAPIRFTADTAQSSRDEAVLEGSVEVERGEQRLQAPQVLFDRLTNTVSATSGVVYGDSQLAVRSETVQADLTRRSGRFMDAEYYLAGRNIQGEAARVDVDYTNQQAHLEKVSISTCERGREFWDLRGGSLEVDFERKRATARNITLAIWDVPILWFPYLSFPITEDRQSGFLAPRGGLDSDNGVDLQIPYYWNIAPNRDMTLAPRVLSKRGLMLRTEYRFLYPRHQGEADVAFLPNDRQADEHRWSVFLRHLAVPLEGRPLHTDLLYQEVSDDDYLDDFGNDLDLLSETSLERFFSSVYFGRRWTVRARLQDFQTIDEEVFPEDLEPYSRLPQLQFRGSWPDSRLGLSYDLYSELVYFHHDDKVRGTRLDLQPTLTMPLEWTYAFLKPRLSYRYTTYWLDDTAPGQDNFLDRGAPVLSLDGGLFFERPVDWDWLGWSGTQTLEPRLFYLYVPYRDQDEIPLFDSVDLDRNYTWLFLENRFTGADRLGDANQVTAALTSRLLEDGIERFRVSLGQILYFRDREVTLENTADNEDSRSDVIAEMAANLPKGFDIRGTLQWTAGQADTRRSSLDIRYRPRPGRQVNFSHRYREGELEQVDLAGIWTINEQWRSMARVNYSLQDNVTLDAFVGAEYGSCCWALRGLIRHHRDEVDDDPDNALLVELELKGLGGIGSGIDKILEDAVLGYERIRYR